MPCTANSRKRFSPGRSSPAASIDKAELCERLGVSRFPVSAAVSRLAYDRLVDVEPQHGSFVARISLERRARAAVHPRRARRRDRRRGGAPNDARRQGRACGQPQASKPTAAADEDPTTFYALDVAFHRILTARLGMAARRRVLDGLRVHLERVRRLTMSPPGQLRASLDRARARSRSAIEAGTPPRRAKR